MPYPGGAMFDFPGQGVGRVTEENLDVQIFLHIKRFPRVTRIA